MESKGDGDGAGDRQRWERKERRSYHDSQFHIGNNLFAPDLLFYIMDFSQVWYLWKAVFKVNPTPYVTKGRDYSLWKTSAITEIAPPGSSWRYLVYLYKK